MWGNLTWSRVLRGGNGAKKFSSSYGVVCDGARQNHIRRGENPTFGPIHPIAIPRWRYIYTNWGGERNHKGLQHGGVWLTLRVLPPYPIWSLSNLFPVFWFSSFSSFLTLFSSSCLEVFRGLNFFKLGIPGKLWINSFHRLWPHAIWS